MTQKTDLIDSFGRKHDYLRISLTDRCNLRCRYCMPQHPEWMPKNQLLTFEEIEQIAGIFIQSFGINKIRFTGGEPLVRSDFLNLFKSLSAYPVELGITSNALLLNDTVLQHFIDLRLHTLNISLDTLNPLKFYYLTRVDAFEKVWNNIQNALKKNFHVKLNVVLMKGINDNELLAFAALTRNRHLDVRFIEFMPFSGNAWQKEKVYSYRNIMDELEKHYELKPIHQNIHATAKSYRIAGYTGSIGIISTVSEAFCRNCNRIRLTADGHLRNCLFTRDEINLRDALRNGEEIEPLIRKAIALKHKQHGGLPGFDKDTIHDELSVRSMTAIGG